MIFKKLISTLAFAITACVCSVSAYAIPTTYYDFSASGSVVNTDLSPATTNYNFSFLLSSLDGTNLNFVSGTYDGASVSSSSPNNIGTLTGGGGLRTLSGFSLDSGFTSPIVGVDLTKSVLSSSFSITEYYNDKNARSGSNNTYIFQVAGAPEIDGSLAPKVGFLLGCLFLIFGRKKSASSELATA